MRIYINLGDKNNIHILVFIGAFVVSQDGRFKWYTDGKTESLRRKSVKEICECTLSIYIQMSCHICICFKWR